MALEGSALAWEQSFRAAAKKDSLCILRAHLKRLELPDKPVMLLEGTILLVQACASVVFCC